MLEALAESVVYQEAWPARVRLWSAPKEDAQHSCSANTRCPRGTFPNTWASGLFPEKVAQVHTDPSGLVFVM